MEERKKCYYRIGLEIRKMLLQPEKVNQDRPCTKDNEVVYRCKGCNNWFDVEQIYKHRNKHQTYNDMLFDPETSSFRQFLKKERLNLNTEIYTNLEKFRDALRFNQKFLTNITIICNG